MEINPVAPKSIISKPLALVIIGLLIGASLGLGTGYALIFPDMVNKREEAIEEQVIGSTRFSSSSMMSEAP